MHLRTENKNNTKKNTKNNTKNNTKFFKLQVQKNESIFQITLLSCKGKEVQGNKDNPKGLIRESAP